jgi:nucleoside-diphosphate-sugar epimerase
MTDRFLVTGSEGCIGAWVVRHLVRAGIPVAAADLSAPGRRIHKVVEPDLWGRVDHHVVDLREPGTVERLLEATGATRIVHLAALQVPLVIADPILGAEVNVTGTVRVLEAARRAGQQVRGISFASSSAAIGLADSPHRPETLYGAYKLLNEHTSRIYARDWKVGSIGLRPCVVYGAARDQGMTAALTHAIKAAVLGVPYRIPFAGLVDLQYAPDVAEAFVRSALADDVADAPVFDLHGDAVTVEQFVAELVRQVPSARSLISIADSRIPGNVDVDDAELLARVGALGKTSLEAGIADSILRFTQHATAGTLVRDEIPPAA